MRAHGGLDHNIISIPNFPETCKSGVDPELLHLLGCLSLRL